MSFFSEIILIGIPAYFANGAPPFLISLKKHPIDFGKKWRGKRLLGDGKTWEGLFFAVLVSTITGVVLKRIVQNNIHLWSFSLIGLGAMLGDMAGSFIKRRKGIKRGAKAGFLDMIDFMIGALILARIVTPYSWITFFTLIIITPIIHRTANIIGHKMGVKKEPW